MAIRFARVEDAPRVREIMELAIGGHPAYPPASREETLAAFTTDALRGLIANAPHSVFVAEDEDGVAGCGLQMHDRGTLFVEWICVDPGMRAKRLGPAMYAFAFDYGRAQGFSKTWGMVRPTNRSSLRFLPRMGCRVMAELKNHWHGVDWLFWEHVYADQPAEGARAKRLATALADDGEPPDA